MTSIPTFAKDIVIRDGATLRLRPIRPDDGPALVELGQRSTPEDVRLRFLSTVQPRLGSLTTMLTQFDPQRHYAVGAFDPARPEDGLLGVVRLIIAPEGDYGEFAIMVRSDFKGRGLGRALMAEMLDWARARDLRRVVGQILHENTRMLHLVKACGGTLLPSDGDYQIVRVAFELQDSQAPATT
jgi:acetyltransferase